ncbi:hypothetical protein V494_08507 [Pseudogymnoascus sp. VKM F-4513 (FW-928)]|nr:hypothetical protein V494_08507 [Pseudogymnoascus sp. VKM F-4513 (FW-928)]
MSDWLQGVDIFDGLETDDGQIPFETASMSVLLSGEESEASFTWTDDLLGLSLGSDPEGGLEGLLEFPPQNGPQGGPDAPSDLESSFHDASMPDAPSVPSTDSTSNPSTAEYGSLHFSFEDSEWDFMNLTQPVHASLNGYREMTPPPPPPPAPGPWDEMDGLQFSPTIPKEWADSPWKEEAGDPFVGTEREGDGGDEENPGHIFANPTNGGPSREEIYGERSRIESFAEGEGEFGEWVDGSWEDEVVLAAARMWGEER